MLAATCSSPPTPPPSRRFLPRFRRRPGGFAGRWTRARVRGGVPRRGRRRRRRRPARRGGCAREFPPTRPRETDPDSNRGDDGVGGRSRRPRAKPRRFRATASFDVGSLWTRAFASRFGRAHRRRSRRVSVGRRERDRLPRRARRARSSVTPRAAAGRRVRRQQRRASSRVAEPRRARRDPRRHHSRALRDDSRGDGGERTGK